MPCKNAKDSTQTFSLCVLGLYGGKPSHGTCVNCDKCTDVEWHKLKVKEMLARQPVTPVSRIVVPRPKPPVLSDVGDKLKGILAGYGIVKVEACNCSGLQAALNAMTREEVIEKIDKLSLALVENLKRNPNVADNAPTWVRLGVKTMRFDPTNIAAKSMAERLLRQSCE